MNLYELFKYDAEMEFTEEPTYWNWVWTPDDKKMLFCWVYWNPEA